jgi:hypothetical protein
MTPIKRLKSLPHSSEVPATTTTLLSSVPHNASMMSSKLAMTPPSTVADKWSTIADVIINEIVSYLHTNERVTIWERICGNYRHSSLTGNGWMHNLHLMEHLPTDTPTSPFGRLNHSGSNCGDDIESDGDTRLRYYHRVRYLTMDYSLSEYGNSDALKWISLTHLTRIVYAFGEDTIYDTVECMPHLLSLTIQLMPRNMKSRKYLEIPSLSTLTSLTVLTSSNRPKEELAICHLPNLRILTIGRGVEFVRSSSCPLIHTLTFGEKTEMGFFLDLIDQCRASLHILTTPDLPHHAFTYLAQHTPHLTSLSLTSFDDDLAQNVETIGVLATITSLQHLSINVCRPLSISWQPLTSLIHLHSLFILNTTMNESLTSLVRQLAHPSVNISLSSLKNTNDENDVAYESGQLMVINGMSIDEWINTMK